jgi:hypothetical protein
VCELPVSAVGPEIPHCFSDDASDLFRLLQHRDMAGW